MKLIGITIAVVVAIAISLASVHFWGLSQPFIPYENKFFTGTPPWVIVPWEFNFSARRNSRN